MLCGGQRGCTDGDFSIAQLNTPTRLTHDLRKQILYVSDTGNNLIRKIDLETSRKKIFFHHIGFNSIFFLFFKSRFHFNSGRKKRWNHISRWNRSRCKIQYSRRVPQKHLFLFSKIEVEILHTNKNRMCMDGSGQLIIADCYNQCVRVVESDGRTTTLVGLPERAGYSNVKKKNVKTIKKKIHLVVKKSKKKGGKKMTLLDHPTSVAIDPITGTLYICETGNQMIRQVIGAASLQGHYSIAKVRASFKLLYLFRGILSCGDISDKKRSIARCCLDIFGGDFLNKVELENIFLFLSNRETLIKSKRHYIEKVLHKMKAL